jgi:hypothetical protein
MIQISQIDIQDTIKYRMPLQAFLDKSIGPILRPACVDRFFDIEPKVSAVSVEYFIDSNSRLPVTSLPVTFWQSSGNITEIFPLQDAGLEFLRAFTEATASVTSSHHFRQVPSVVQERGPALLADRNFCQLNVVYLPDVTIMMQADIGENLQEIDGETWSTEEDLSNIVCAVTGAAFYVPEDSHHARINQISRIQNQAMTFDGIIREQAETSLQTTFFPKPLRT